MPESLLRDFEEMFAASLDPRALRERLGLPHPLYKFATNGGVKDNAYSEAILRFLNDKAWADLDSTRHRIATWFLFESEKALFLACHEAGIDAEAFRNHLRNVQAGEFAASTEASGPGF